MEIIDQLRSLFEKSLLQINHEVVDSLSKSLLRLISSDDVREHYYSCGLASDICGWFVRCNDYFLEISNAVRYSIHSDTPVNVTVSMSVLSIATNLLRLLRNMCSNYQKTQCLVLSSGVVHCISGLCVDKHLWAAGEMVWSEWYELFIQVGLQVLFNVTAGAPYSIREKIWSEYLPHCFQFLMKHYSHNQKLTSYAIALIYNLLNSSNPLPEELQQYMTLVQSPDILTLIFSQGLSSDDNSSSSLSSQWIFLILERLCSLHSSSSPLLTLALSSLHSSSFIIISPAQFLFLSFLLDLTDSSPDLPLPDSLCEHLLTWLLNIIHASHTLEINGDTLLFNELRLLISTDESTQGKEMMMMINSINSCCCIVAGQANHFSDSLKSFIIHSEWFHIILAILAIPQIVIEQSSTMVTGDCGEKQGKPMITQRTDVWSYGTRDAVLQILGNTVYMNREAQDQLREKGGIELVLNHTKMHSKHPLQREWALFTIRNCCADNEENQAYIDQFKAESIITEPALEKIGVKVS